MKKMMDPVAEAEKIIADYLGGKPYAPRRVKSHRRRRGEILGVCAGAVLTVAAAVIFFL